ncbi:MAG: hypothetical protein ACYS8Z_01720 [Planctomycetota bacterium]|jgi:hypothetical protein
MRERITIVVLVVAACFVSSCCRIDFEPSDIDAEWAGMKLHEKAEAFRSELAEHNTADDLFAYRLSTTSGTPEVTPSTLSDTAYMTGWLLGAEAMRYKVTGEQDAADRITYLVDGLHRLQQITGIDGYFARAFTKDDVVEPLGWIKGEGAYDEYFWKGDTSKDQYTAVMFGYSLAYSAIEGMPAMQPTEDMIVADVRKIGEALIANDYQIIGEEGLTKDGDLSPRILGWPIGLNALMRLAWIKIADQITGDMGFGDAYDELLDDRLHKIVANPCSIYARTWPFRCPDYVNNNMAFLNFYSILQIGTGEDEYYKKALGRKLFWVKRTNYPFWNFVYAAFCDNASKKERAIEKGIETLSQFPRGPGKFWGHRQREGVKYAGTAFLASYWLARAEGFISQDE